MGVPMAYLLLHLLFLLYAIPRKSQALCRKFTSALSVTFGDSSPKGGASGVSVGFHAGQAKHDVSGTVVLRCLGQRQRDKVRLFRSRCPL